MTSTVAHFKSLLLSLVVVAAFGTASSPGRADTPSSHFGGTRVRADRPITDARFGADGRRILGIAGGTVYVWDVVDGSLVRKVDTKLDVLDDPTKNYGKGLAFALHPKETRFACGGVRDGKTYLQLWDFNSGKLIAERASTCDAIKILAWTPDGSRLLERANFGWVNPTGWKLIVRDGTLQELHSHGLPANFGEWSTVMAMVPGSRQVILWGSARLPTLFDLESGAAVRTIDHKVAIPSDLAVTPDGKTLVATDTDTMWLLDLATGKPLRSLPVFRDGSLKPRPLFSPDSQTVYVYDFQPFAYDVATGKQRWRAFPRTVHSASTKLSDISPDGATLLVRHGHAVSLLDAKTGAERNPAQEPSLPSDLIWSPDGKTLFTRTVRHDRTWTAWEPATGKRLFDMQPTGVVADDNWKMLPDLFFIAGGKEIATGLEHSERTERNGQKEFLVFDATTGKCKRRLGAPFPLEEFRTMHPVGVEGAGSIVRMQGYAMRSFVGPEQYATVRWDPVKQAKIKEWGVDGNRATPPRHFAPFDVTVMGILPSPDMEGEHGAPATIRIYSPVDGKLVHQLPTDFVSIELDRLQGNFLVSLGHDSKWVTRNRTTSFEPQPPFVYELWELPSRDEVRLFERERTIPVVLGPGGKYLIRVLDTNSFEVYEPFALKKTLIKVATTSRPEKFEFSPDGNQLAVSLSDTSIAIWDTAPWRKQIDESLAKSVPTDLAPLWDDLAKDAATGLRAARLLSAVGDAAVSLLGAKIAPKKAADNTRIAGWIADLGSPQFATREKAEKELRNLSAQAERQLRNALRGTLSAEVRQRIGNLLRAVEAHDLTGEERREVRAVQALTWMDSVAARTLLVKWATGDPNAALTKAADKAK